MSLPPRDFSQSELMRQSAGSNLSAGRRVGQLNGRGRERREGARLPFPRFQPDLLDFGHSAEGVHAVVGVDCFLADQIIEVEVLLDLIDNDVLPLPGSKGLELFLEVIVVLLQVIGINQLHSLLLHLAVKLEERLAGAEQNVVHSRLDRIHQLYREFGLDQLVDELIQVVQLDARHEDVRVLVLHLGVIVLFRQLVALAGQPQRFELELHHKVRNLQLFCVLDQAVQVILVDDVAQLYRAGQVFCQSFFVLVLNALQLLAAALKINDFVQDLGLVQQLPGGEALLVFDVEVAIVVY